MKKEYVKKDHAKKDHAKKDHVNGLALNLHLVKNLEKKIGMSLAKDLHSHGLWEGDIWDHLHADRLDLALDLDLDHISVLDLISDLDHTLDSEDLGEDHHLDLEDLGECGEEDPDPGECGEDHQ